MLINSFDMSTTFSEDVIDNFHVHGDTLVLAPEGGNTKPSPLTALTNLVSTSERDYDNLSISQQYPGQVISIRSNEIGRQITLTATCRVAPGMATGS